MAQAGSILANVRVLAGDPDKDFITDAVGLDWINQAQKRFCHNVLPLDEFKDYAITSKQPRFDLPTDAIIPIWAMWFQQRTQKLEYRPPSRWAYLIEGWPNATGTPDAYTVIRRQLVVGPQTPQTNSATALFSNALDSSATTISLTAASGTFRSKGWLILQGTGGDADEVVEYTAVSTTEVTGVVRGVHNTTAATHASGKRVTEVDLQMLYRRAPNAISTTTTEPDVPRAYQDYLEKYCLYLAWIARGDMEKAQVALSEFEEYERATIKSIGRRSLDGLIQIQDRWRARWY